MTFNRYLDNLVLLFLNYVLNQGIEEEAKGDASLGKETVVMLIFGCD